MVPKFLPKFNFNKRLARAKDPQSQQSSVQSQEVQSQGFQQPGLRYEDRKHFTDHKFVYYIISLLIIVGAFLLDNSLGFIIAILAILFWLYAVLLKKPLSHAFWMFVPSIGIGVVWIFTFSVSLTLISAIMVVGLGFFVHYGRKKNKKPLGIFFAGLGLIVFFGLAILIANNISVGTTGQSLFQQFVEGGSGLEDIQFRQTFAPQLSTVSAILSGEFNPNAQKWDSRRVQDNYVVPEDAGVLFEDVSASREVFYSDPLEIRGSMTVVSLFEDGRDVDTKTTVTLDVSLPECNFIGRGFPGISKSWCKEDWVCTITGLTSVLGKDNTFEIDKAFNKFFTCRHSGIDIEDQSNIGFSDFTIARSRAVDLDPRFEWRYTTQAISGRQVFVASPDTLDRIENLKTHYNIPKASFEPWSISDGSIDFAVGFDQGVDFLRADKIRDEVLESTLRFLNGEKKFIENEIDVLQGLRASDSSELSKLKSDRQDLEKQRDTNLNEMDDLASKAKFDTSDLDCDISNTGIFFVDKFVAGSCVLIKVGKRANDYAIEIDEAIYDALKGDDRDRLKLLEDQTNELISEISIFDIDIETVEGKIEVLNSQISAKRGEKNAKIAAINEISPRFSTYFLGVSITNDKAGEVVKINNLTLVLPADPGVIALDAETNVEIAGPGDITGDFVYVGEDALNFNPAVKVYELRVLPFPLEADNQEIRPGGFKTFYMKIAVNKDYLQGTSYQSFFVQGNLNYDYKHDRKVDIRVEAEPFRSGLD